VSLSQKQIQPCVIENNPNQIFPRKPRQLQTLNFVKSYSKQSDLGSGVYQRRKGDLKYRFLKNYCQSDHR